MKNDLTILRYESCPAGTFGVALHGTRWLCHTLEPASRSGLFRQALLAARYELRLEWSPRFKQYLPTIIAPGRSGIRIHAGNRVSQTQGCVLVGRARYGDYVRNSVDALRKLIEYIKEHNINFVTIIDYETISC